jgi:flagellar basal body-associated protein FliL
MSDQFGSPVLQNEAPAKKKSPWITVLIIVVVLVVLCFLCVIVSLAVMGPSIGNVFSNIQEGLMTPAP